MFLQGKILPTKLFLTHFCARQAFWAYFSARYTKSVATPALKWRHWNGPKFDRTHQIGVCVYHVSEEDHDEVGVDVTFVNLVDNDVRNTSKAGLKFTKKNSHGAEHD